MKKVNLFILVIAVMILFAGCTKDRRTNENPAGSAGTNTDKTVQPEIPMRDYFPPDGSKGHFKGEGNEFAEFNIEVTQPHEDYFVIFEDNGGATIRRIYKINKDRIDILDSNIVDGIEHTFPSLDELNSMEATGIYLQQPFSEGTMFDDWTIVKTGLTVETPYQTFDNAIAIERKEKDVVNRKYFVSGFGEVKRESVMKTGDGEIVTVTSTLESLGK